MRKFIKGLKSGDEFEAVFLLKKKEMKKTKENKPYLNLILSDKTGTIESRVWDDAEQASARIGSSGPVWVKAAADVWKDNIQLRVQDIRTAQKDEYEMSDIMRAVEDIQGIKNRVKDMIGSIKDKWLKLLAESFLLDNDFMDKFEKAPGAQSWHNAYIGGLLEHTFEVMFIADKVCGLYPQANRDICLVGAFLHDIGKIHEIDPVTFEATIEGGLIGHLSLGFEMLSRKIGEIDGFPEDAALFLKHGILSHHGEYEQQSPVLPKTLEATIVYHSDELVSQANAIKELIEGQAGVQKTWSNFVSIKNRKYLLLKPDKAA